MSDILLIAIIIVILLVCSQGGYVTGAAMNIIYIVGLILIIYFLYRMLAGPTVTTRTGPVID